MGIGRRIKEARLRQRLTQEELGRRLGITKGAVANYENDTSHPKETVLYRIFQVLSVDANFLFQDVMPAESSQKASPFPLFSEAELSHLEQYRRLSDYSRETIDYLMQRELLQEAAQPAVLSAGQIAGRSAAAAVPASAALPASASAAADDNSVSAEQREETAADTKILQLYPYLNMAASAGTSTYIDDLPQEQIEAPFCRRADFIIGVSGDSMKPLYQSGDLLYVERTDQLSEGEIGIFSKDDGLYVKKAGKDRLISINPDFPDITADSDVIRVVGRVLGRVAR